MSEERKVKLQKERDIEIKLAQFEMLQADLQSANFALNQIHENPNVMESMVKEGIAAVDPSGKFSIGPES